MSFSLRMGSLLKRLAQEQSGETGYSPYLVHPLVSWKPSLAQDPEAKGKKKIEDTQGVEVQECPYFWLLEHTRKARSGKTARWRTQDGIRVNTLTPKPQQAEANH